jgi:hypothetical protein
MRAGERFRDDQRGGLMARWFLRSLLLAAVVAGVAPAAAGADWTPGATLNSSTSIGPGSPSITDVNGVPYAAWQPPDSGQSDELYVDRWTGTAWVQVGGALNVDTTAAAQSPSIANVNGVPYVAWAEGGDAPHVYVAHWNGSSWVHDGGAVDAGITGRGTSPSIAAVDGVPYVAWQEEPTGGVTQVYVAQWSGTAWVDDGDPLNSNAAHQASAPTIVGIGSVPYVAWAEDNGSGVEELFVAHYSAGSWSEDVTGYTNPAFTTPSIDGTPQIADVGGSPYVTFTENDAGVDDLYAGFVSGGEFVPLGAALNEFSGQAAEDPSITDVGDTPFISFTQTIRGQKEQLFVKQWNGTTWALVGAALNTGTIEKLRSSITSVGGVPFVEWSGFGSGTIASVTDVSYLQPGFSDEQAIATDTGALLTVEVKDYDTQLPVAFQYGRGSSLTTTTAAQTTDGTGSATIVQAIGGLSPKTKYSWRAIATDGTATTATDATATLTTRPANGPGPAGPPGPPGKVELVTCKKVGKVEKCTSKLVSGPVRFTVSSAHVASLARGKVVYARVEVLERGHGPLRLIVLHRLRRLTAGKYTLISGRSHQTIELG